MDLTYSLTPKLEKLIKKLEKRQATLVTEFETVRDAILREPGTAKQLKGNLREFQSYDWTYRGIALRVCFAHFESDNHVQFVWFGTRENFYTEVARYLPSTKN